MPRLPLVVGHRDPLLRALGRRRTWLLAALGAVVGGVAGGLLVLAMPPRYEATVAVELTQISPQVNTTEVGPRADPVTIDTDAQLLTSDSVVNAIEFTSDRPAEEIRANLTVGARPLTQVMTISYADETEESALSGAQTAAEFFLQIRDQLILRPVREHLDTVAEQGGLVDGADDSVAGANQRAVELRRQAALVTRMNLQNAGSVLENARLTASGEREGVEVVLGSAVGLGALSGIGLAVARERRHHRRGDPGTSGGATPWA